MVLGWQEVLIRGASINDVHENFGFFDPVARELVVGCLIILGTTHNGLQSASERETGREREGVRRLMMRHVHHLSRYSNVLPSGSCMM